VRGRRARGVFSRLFFPRDDATRTSHTLNGHTGRKREKKATKYPKDVFPRKGKKSDGRPLYDGDAPLWTMAYPMVCDTEYTYKKRTHAGDSLFFARACVRWSPRFSLSFLRPENDDDADAALRDEESEREHGRRTDDGRRAEEAQTLTERESKKTSVVSVPTTRGV